MKRSFFFLTAAGIIIMSLFPSCYSGSFEPYLVIDMKDEYPSGTVTIGYSFLSERNEQACRVYLYVGEDVERIYCNDQRLPDTGSLVFPDMSPGWYTLYFAVLSERGDTPVVIPFLEQSRSFQVR